MSRELFVVVVDTRGMDPSNIDGYKEHTCTQDFFDQHVKGNPKVRCVRSKVAEMCGLDMKIYYHEHTPGHVRLREDFPDEGRDRAMEDMQSPLGGTNAAASLLTFDPNNGDVTAKVLGKAYVLVNNGDYPLSNHQVWGIQELINEAKDVYDNSDVTDLNRGLNNLRRWCNQYQDQQWGPLTVYLPRKTRKSKPECISVETAYHPGGRDCHHCHHKDCGCWKCRRNQTTRCAKCQRHYDSMAHKLNRTTNKIEYYNNE